MRPPQSLPGEPGSRKRMRTTLALAGAAIALLPGAAQAAESAPGELLVRFDPGVSRSEGAAVAGELDSSISERLPGVPNLVLVDLPRETTVAEADRAFSSLSEVRYAEPNFAYRVDLAPNDPFFSELWGLENNSQAPFSGTVDADIDATEAWDVTLGDPSVKVAVIDSGVTVTHPDLAGNIVAADNRDFLEEDTTPDDESSHGTHVAGTIGAVGNNATGITGVSQNVGLMALKAGSASGVFFTSDIVDAIEYAQDNGARVANGSFSGSGSSISFANAISFAPDILFVFAAGNGGANGVGDDNDANPQYPCNVDLPNVVCVAATGQTDSLASFSNFGRSSVDLAAPGTGTYSTAPSFKAPPEFEDDFTVDDFAVKWTVGGTNGTWARVAGNPSAPAPTSARLLDSPAGDYLPSADHFTQIATPLNLTGEIDCRVRLNVNHSLGSGDALRLEASSDPGAPVPTWGLIGLWSGTGNSAAVRELEGFDGDATVALRFRFVSDASPSTVGAGVSIDNIVVECLDPAGEAYSYKQGTSMAAPHVSGTAALLLADDPDLTVNQLRNTLLASVDPLPGLACRVFTGGRLNAARALALSPVTSPPQPASCPAASTPPPVVQPQPEVVVVPKCKKPKKGASAKAKSKFKKCKRKRKKALSAA